MASFMSYIFYHNKKKVRIIQRRRHSDFCDLLQNIQGREVKESKSETKVDNC